MRGNAGDGIHGASAGGLWQAAVFGFAGLQFSEEGPRLQPSPAGHFHAGAYRVGC